MRSPPTTTLFVVFLLLLRPRKVSSFVPPARPLHVRTQTNPETSPTTLHYKQDRDEIAHELVEELGAADREKLRKVKTHDGNPWKHVLEQQQEFHGMVTELTKEERVHKADVKRLEDKMDRLYFITQQLAAIDLEEAAKLKKYEEERNSVRKLTGRIFRVIGGRIASRIGKVKNGVLKLLGVKKG